MKEKVQNFLTNHGKATALFVSLSIILVLVLIVINLASPKKLRVSFLDVGQGDAILVQTPGGHDMLIDGGPTREVLAKLAYEMGYFDRGLDVVIATHGDADHVTGLIPVLETYDVKKIVRSPVDGDTSLFSDLSSYIEREDADVYVGRKGDMIDFGDGVVAYVLYPRTNISPKTDTNDASVSVVVVYGEHSFLLTGDLGMKYESELIHEKLPRRITVFKAGHHGSKTSSGEQLLTYIKPEYAVISAGKENRYGHPHPETIERLQKYSQEILETSDRGTISFISDGRMLEVSTERK